MQTNQTARASTTGEDQGTPATPPLNRHQRRKLEKAQRTQKAKCPFPDCGKHFVPEEGKPGACPEHRKLIADVLFIINHTTAPKVETEDDRPAIFVPKPGQGKQAIDAAAKAAGRG